MISLTLTERIFEKYIEWIPRVFICVLLLYVSIDFGGHHYQPESLFRFFTCILTSFWLLMPFRKLPVIENIKIPLAGFLITSFLSTIFSAYVHDSFLEWSNFLCYILLFVMIYDLFSAPRFHHFFIHFLMFTGFVVCCTGVFFFLFFQSEKGGMYGTFYQADVFGGFLLLFFPLSCLLFYKAREPVKLILYGIFTALSGTCMIMTYSRGVMLSLIAAMLILFILMALRKVKGIPLSEMLIKSLVIIIIIVLASRLFSMGKTEGHVKERLKERAVELVSEGDSSRLARLQFWKAALKISMDYPFFGTGLKTFGRFYPPYEDDVRHFSKYVHNLYLQVASEMGWLTFFFFMALLWCLFRGFFRLLPSCRDDDFLYFSHLGIGIGAIASFIHHFVDVDWFFAALPAVWIAFFAASMGRMTRFTAGGEVKEEATGFRDEDFLIRGLSRHMAAQFGLCIFLMLFSLIMILPFFAQRFAEQAEIHKIKGKIPQAIEGYSIALKLDPFNSEMQRNLGDLFLLQAMSGRDEKENLRRALHYAQQAASVDPHRAVLHHFVGKIYWRMNVLEEALSSFKKAIELDGKNYPSFYNDTATYYAEKGDNREAEKYYITAIRIFPLEVFRTFWPFRAGPTKAQLSETYLGLGNIYLKEKKFSEAESLFKTSIELQKENFSAYFAKSYSLYQQKKFNEALSSFLETKKLDQKFPLTYLFLGYTYRELGNIPESERNINEAYTLDPNLRKQEKEKK